jgi:hypothetical protein
LLNLKKNIPINRLRYVSYLSGFSAPERVSLPKQTAGGELEFEPSAPSQKWEAMAGYAPSPAGCWLLVANRTAGIGATLPFTLTSGIDRRCPLRDLRVV